MSGGWARNTIIFRGLGLLRILNSPDDPRFCSLHLPRGSLLLHIAPQISDEFLRFPTQCLLQFVNLQEALSEQLGENWGFPQDTEPCLFVFSLAVLMTHVHGDNNTLLVGVHEAPTGSVTTPLLHG